MGVVENGDIGCGDDREKEEFIVGVCSARPSIKSHEILLKLSWQWQVGIPFFSSSSWSGNHVVVLSSTMTTCDEGPINDFM